MLVIDIPSDTSARFAIWDGVPLERTPGPGQLRWVDRKQLRPMCQTSQSWVNPISNLNKQTLNIQNYKTWRNTCFIMMKIFDEQNEICSFLRHVPVFNSQKLSITSVIWCTIKDRRWWKVLNHCSIQGRTTSTTLMYKNVSCFLSFPFITRNVRMGRVRDSRGWLRCTLYAVMVRFF